MVTNNSLTEENYLKAIFHLSQRGLKKTSPTAIAEELKVNTASVVEMIRKLVEKKLITYEKTKGVKLSEKGQKLALGIVRLHRLWEVFLLSKLEYTWDHVHEIAEQLEHVKHHELANRLDKFLGYPEYDPHGDPIPKASGELPKLSNTLLSESEPGKSYRVAAVKDTSVPFLQYLQQLSINIGCRIKVIKKIEFDGSMVIKVNKEDTATVSNKLAANILVN